MSLTQQFYSLPEELQQEVLDFMVFVAKRKGIKLEEHKAQASSRWLKQVNRMVNTGKPISETVVQMREEEKW